MLIREKIIKAYKLLEDILNQKNIAHQKVTLVGSVATQTNIACSDIDFVTGINYLHKEEVKSLLTQSLEFRGERIATPNTTRLLFCTKIGGIHVDLNIMEEKDYFCIIDGMMKMASELSSKQKKEIKKSKNILKEKGNIQEYELYKNKFYQKFCPEFLWISDIDIIRKMAEDCLKSGTEYPKWLKDKISTGL